MSFWNRKSYSNSESSNSKKYIGVSSYAMVYRPDEFRGASNWKVNLHVEPEVEKQIKADGIQLGVKTHPAENVDIERYFTFRRPTERKFSRGISYFCPPAIYDKDGNTLVAYELDGKRISQFDDPDADVQRVGEPILIGNGSLIELRVDVYDTKGFGKGNRFNSIKILDLVEYEPEEVEPEEEVEEKEVSREKYSAKPSAKPAPKQKGKAPW